MQCNSTAVATRHSRLELVVNYIYVSNLVEDNRLELLDSPLQRTVGKLKEDNLVP